MTDPCWSKVVSKIRWPLTYVSACGLHGVSVTIPSVCAITEWRGWIPGPNNCTDGPANSANLNLISEIKRLKPLNGFSVWIIHVSIVKPPIKTGAFKSLKSYKTNYRCQSYVATIASLSPTLPSEQIRVHVAIDTRYSNGYYVNRSRRTSQQA